jgi:glycosyltransferase involved in cell wall biosynthesis
VGGLSPEGRIVTTCTIVIPCYNEERRLDREAVIALADMADCSVLLVDDGSTDGTLELLHSIAATDPRVGVHRMSKNVGKSEAVRNGLLAATASGATLVGFTDADFATPPAEVARLVHAARNDSLRVVIGSRVGLLGHRIARRHLRHYTGRLFATLSSLVLGFGVYDTQCGAKVFATGDTLAAALQSPFVGRWSFDVELLGRLAAWNGTDGFLEVPLVEWHEVGGSKLGFVGSVGATVELLRVRRELRRYARTVTRR